MNIEQFCFVNEQGLFGDPDIEGVLTEHAFEQLTAYAKSSHASTIEKQLLDQTLPLLGSLEVRNHHVKLRKNDAPNLTSKDENIYDPGFYGYQTCPHRVVVVPSRFTASFSPYNREQIQNDQSQWGWAQASKLYPFKTALSKLCTKLDLSLSTGCITRGSKLQEKMSAGTLKTRSSNPSSDLGLADAWVIYAPSSGRYMDSQFNAVTLASARMFESQGAVERTLTKYGNRREGVIIKVKTQIVEVSPGQKISAGLGSLNDALALLQREQLWQALQSADMETLKKRVAELENQLPAQDAAAQDTVKPRRM